MKRTEKTKQPPQPSKPEPSKARFTTTPPDMKSRFNIKTTPKATLVDKPVAKEQPREVPRRQLSETRTDSRLVVNAVEKSRAFIIFRVTKPSAPCEI